MEPLTVDTYLIILIVLVALLAIAIAMAVWKPRLFVRCLFRPVLEIFYRKRVVGLENFPTEGGCLLVSNHTSWIDGILILWALPRNVRFVVDGSNFTSKIGDYLGRAFDTIFMMGGPKSIGRAIRDAREGLNNGDVVGIFPEGTITRTGQLQAFRPGMSKILKNTDAKIVPVHLEGMWGSIFSFSGGKYFWKWPDKFRRTITVYVGEPLPADAPISAVRGKVQALGSKAQIDHRREFPVLARQVLRVWRRRGKRLQAADTLGTEVGGRKLLINTLALRRCLHREVFAKDEQFVGILLPPSVGAVAVNVALAADRRVSANLNYTVSSDVMNHCIRDVGIKHVLTSDRFLEKIDVELDAEIVSLDKLKEKVSLADKVIAALQATIVPSWLLDRILGLNKVQSDDLLTVIFTSGSTGMPKGVLLSNANVSHNVDAVNRAIRLNTEDVVIGVLPFFHSFGYAVTLWAAQTLGPAGVYHFNPLDSKQIGKLAEKYKATVLLGTPTFMRGYLRRITPEQFKTLNVAVVGAEKMPADLFDAFEKRFGVRPVEGYGTTEMSPLVSVNIPPSRSAAKFQPDRVEGSVGRPLPGISARIVSPDDGTELDAGEDGMLLVTGPNVMRGYANRDDLTQTAVVDGWYTTGDIAHIDGDGFLHITGRLSRFSKIAGEMVPHVRIEEELGKLLADGDDDDQVRVCVTAVPCERKGERIIVLHLPTSQTPDSLREGLKAAGLANLFIPSADSFFEVDEIPLLGTGKLDLKGARDRASELTMASC
ncbi:MAG TPA: acyl-[ACP]--phospholipid O-acyltransferase [Rhodopirellula baltica]|uniref:2-acylglycerophosphoethanolamine acyltransferase and acyl-acyl carrier protein synthetase (AAS bifunctional protein) n=2 Tax=Rhodopirellula baltica TaxID=265606 RepID=Q7UQ42_RHOBA|nr:AMP-binding protein [Rhodopirellula baltica]ELP31739.1 bifunctional acyl-[acyl carrier protein] synthetase/2-acylglycerophosphoethanolamine acyltransferase [Rhodopirellula baltica SWK14]CAD74863.1 2-acylglycerophosphoethanolamine acyltransferase and acyl-acyl carrier protein synthetase (AAS bifunctional protein) [Rhodopirellula baltica SH 1]HBE62608.1 acyl-[ACP]--phospholipid O-acyltransferase [Rhodopirellula baltica]